MSKNKKNKTTSEKPISLHPLKPEEALKALLDTKPPKKKKKKDDGKNKAGI